MIRSRIGNIHRISGHTIVDGRLSRHSIVLDLGANRGEFSSVVSRNWMCQVYAFEPTPNLIADSVGANVIVRQMAIGARSGQQAFRIDSANSEASSLCASDGDNRLHVEVVTLESVLAMVGHVELVKMDIEGAEMEVLASTADMTLQTIPQLSVEFHDFTAASGVRATDVRRAIGRMNRLGFVSLVCSFWTRGDVLFLNTRFFDISVLRRGFLHINARWRPGLARVTSRWMRAS